MVKKNHYYDEDDEDFETCLGMDTGIVGRQITDLDEIREMCRKDAEEDRRRGIEPTSLNFDDLIGIFTYGDPNEKFDVLEFLNRR